VPFVTIDPPDAKDHDDAVHAEPDTARDNPGGYIVHVAIADVASYVNPGSALDREALARGNSVYFPDRVVPMLPERISNDLCSLRASEDRPCFGRADDHRRRWTQTVAHIPPDPDAFDRQSSPISRRNRRSAGGLMKTPRRWSNRCWPRSMQLTK
jgi:hypothetical protein